MGQDTREFRAYAAQLQASNRELESFAYSVSHDLRAPLRAIQGFSKILLEDYDQLLDARGQDYLGRVVSEAERMAQLIEDLLMLSRLTSQEMRVEAVDLSTMAREVLDLLAGGDSGRQVEVCVDEVEPVQGDPSMLRQLMENLLGNAWKFTANQEQAQISMGLTRDNGQAAYFVRDNGVGFDMAHADKLFVPFRRLHTTSEFPGNGVGLSTVYRVVQQHGGQIWFASAEGEGATFYFTLPDPGEADPSGQVLR